MLSVTLVTSCVILASSGIGCPLATILVNKQAKQAVAKLLACLPKLVGLLGLSLLDWLGAEQLLACLKVLDYLIYT
jgi:hypothetical protein